jgi:L-2-hydroxyglutarate oxidase LhgO
MVCAMQVLVAMREQHQDVVERYEKIAAEVSKLPNNSEDIVRLRK